MQESRHVDEAGRRGARLALLVLACGVILRLLLYGEGSSPDSDRYLEQASGLARSQSFLNALGGAETGLPPGYPILLVLVTWITSDPENVRWLQLALSVSAAWLVYRAIAPVSVLGGLLGCAAIALNPLTMKLTWFVLSETLGVFLSAALVLCVSRHERGRGGLASAALTGAIAAALGLTSPFCLALAALLCVAALFRLRRSPEKLLALVFGGLTLLAPWQLHCWLGTGRLEPLLYDPQPSGNSGSFVLWLRTWTRTEADMDVWHDPSAFDRTPAHVFASTAERATLAEARQAMAFSESRETEATFEASARRRIEADPFSFWIGLPIVRAANLWLRMPQVSHAQMEYVGWPRPRDPTPVSVSRNVARIGKAGVSSLAYLAYLLPVVLFLWGIAVFARTRNLFVLAALAGTACYTAVAAHVGGVESRRNTPFYPALALCARPLARLSKARALEAEERAGSESPGVSQESAPLRLSARTRALGERTLNERRRDSTAGA